MNNYDENREFKKNNIDLDDILDEIKYDFKGYVPKKASIKFVEFRKLLRGKTENKTPLVHYKILDNIFTRGSIDDAVLAHRGLSKTTIAEELYWYISCFNKLPEFGTVNLSLYIGDSIDNGVKTMKTSMDISYETSDFLQNMLPKMITTDYDEKKGYYSTQKEIAFVNANKERTWLKLFGAMTGVRGTRAGLYRPEFAIFDDLIQKEEIARSEPSIQSIESTVYSDVEDAMHPSHRKLIWFGTPFNQNDPLYKAIVSGAWRISVYPVCEKFPCKKDEFSGSWEDRFSWDAVMSTYKKRKFAGKSDLFYREMMLRVAPMENKLIQETDIVWFSREPILTKKNTYNYVITTDFATSEKDTADFSVILVWAIDSDSNRLLVDGFIGKNTMSKNINELFRLAQIYRNANVGIEVTGQQGGFVDWIRDEMVTRKIYFSMASANNSNVEGIRPVKDKFSRLMEIEPLFKLKKIWFAKELKNTELMNELLDEIKKTTINGIKAKHDDALDALSMLGSIEILPPSDTQSMTYNPLEKIFEAEDKSDLDTFGENLIL